MLKNHLTIQSPQVLLLKFPVLGVNKLDGSPDRSLPVAQLPSSKDNAIGPAAKNRDSFILFSQLIRQVLLVRFLPPVRSNEPTTHRRHLPSPVHIHQNGHCDDAPHRSRYCGQQPTGRLLPADEGVRTSRVKVQEQLTPGSPRITAPNQACSSFLLCVQLSA